MAAPRSLAASLLGAIALLGAAGAAGAPVNAYTASSEPAVVKPAASRTYTIRLTNDPTSPDRAQRVRIGIPAGFSVSAASAATSAAGVCVATPWVADGTLIANGAVNLKKPQGNTTELCPGGTLTVSITASAPEDGLWTWTTELLRDVIPFALQGPQPTVRVDGTPPVVLINSAPSDPANDPTPTFAFSANEAAAFECKVDAAAFTPCASPYTHSALSDGAHTFSVRALDAAGNASTTVVHAWTIGTVGPLTDIDAAPPAFSSSRSASFAFSSAAAGTTFDCKLDQSAFAPCASPQEYVDLADGVHNFQVRATDASGTGSPIGHTWTIDATAPTSTIQTKPAPLVRATNATFAFSADEAGVTFQCKLDLGAFAACASPKAYSSLADGTHTFSVTATDRAGNAGLPATYAWTVDTAPPNTTITGSPPSASASTSASFSFTASETGSSFECQLDGAAFTACASPHAYAGLTQGQHTFSVRAIDGAGNVDPTPGSVAWAVDTIAPETTIPTKPPALTNSTAASLGFASDETATFECKLDAADFSACGASQSYSSLSNGPHVVTVRARDLAGNVDATPASYTWTIDTVPPDTTILSGPSDPSSSGLAVFTFSSSESGSTFECKVDTGSFSTCTTPASYSLADGTHTFTVRALDAAGNADLTAAAATWRIDTLEPDTTITAKPSDPTTSRDATFSFSSSDTGVTFECRLGADAFAPCSSPKSYTSLAEARHTFAVRTRDGSGNVDQTPATHSWSVDVTSPDTSIASGPPNPSGSRDAVFVIGASEPGGSLQCKLDAAPFAACASPVLYSNLAEGPHTVQTRAIDAAGNVDPTAAQHAWTVDVTAPTTTIDAGPTGATNDPNATFSFSSGEVAAVFECQRDGAEYAPCTSPKAYTSLSDGSHTFRVRARDAAGNVDQTPETRTWTVDTVAPVVTLTLPLDGSATNDPTPGFSGTAGVTVGDSTMVTVRVHAGPSVAGAILQTFAIVRVGGSWAGAAAPLADGVYTARAEQVDAANNTGYSAPVMFTVDTAGPGIAIFERPPDPTSATAATFTFSSSDPDVTLRCSLDGGPFVLCQSPLTYQALPAGRHTFSVNATDRSGNVGGNATYSWSVEIPAQPPAPPPPLPAAPPSPPPAPDRTPPTEVANVRVRVASATVSLTWVLPTDADFDRVSVSRITPGKTVRRATIYEGAARSVTDRGLVNGVRYRYRLTTRDKAGNTSAGVEVAAIPEALLTPAEGAKVASPPLLRWQPIRRATYYNVQLWRVETSGQAQAARLVKILSAWPSAPRLKLSSRWTFAGKSYRLRPGSYRWYVFPGLGKRAVARYGAFMGENRFTVVASKKR